MSRAIVRAALLAFVASVFVPCGASAQGGRPSQLQVERTAGAQAGVRATLSTERPDAWGYGVQLRLPIDWNLAAEPSVDLWSVNGNTWWQANADLLALDRRGWFYGRLGLAVAGRQGQDTKVGVNAGIGSDLPFLFETPLRPFVEARWTVIDGQVPLRVLIGANFTFGKR
jgi:hypothetical protein